MLLTNNDREFLRKEYPWMTEISDNVIEWVISFSAKYDSRSNQLLIDNTSEEALRWKFKIRINFFPHKFPEVREINGDLKRWLDFHIYEDGRFCLTHTIFERKYRNIDVKQIMEEFVIPFLYNQIYNQIHSKADTEFLWEYSHGHQWTFECIQDGGLWIADYKLVMEIITPYLPKDNINLFLYSEKERDRLKGILGLKTSKSRKWFVVFVNHFKAR